MRTKLIILFLLISSAISSQVPGKKLLPTEIEMGHAKLYYTYDKQNRFTTIKILMRNKLYDYDSIAYNGNKVMLYTIDKSLRAIVEIDKKDKYTYSYKYFAGNQTVLLNIIFNSQYKISIVEYKTDENDNNPVTYKFKYDRNSNIKDIIVPDNITSEEVNSTFKIFMFYNVYYDNKIGIFRHIDPITSPIITLQDNTFPYILFMGGNKIDAIVKNSNRKSDASGGVYNEHGYPIELGVIEVKRYIELNN